MSGAAKASGGFATAIAVGLTLTACGSSTPKQRHTPPLSVDQLKAGMLPPSAFGSGLHYDLAGPVVYPGTAGDITLVTQKMDCTQLIFGGDRDAAVASADAIGSGTMSARGFYERAGQYHPGDAATVLKALAEQGRAKCASFSYSLPDTTGTISDTSTVTAEPHLGDQAFLFEQSETSSGIDGAQVSDTLTVEYGDVLVSVGCNGNQTEARACDLPTVAKQLAQSLKLT